MIRDLRTRPIRSFFACGFLVVATVSGLRADVSGSILGSVTDTSGGVLPGAEIVATNLETNLTQATRSDTLASTASWLSRPESTKLRRRSEASKNSW